MGDLANSEDPDKMQHYTAFYWGLHCLLGVNNLHRRNTLCMII